MKCITDQHRCEKSSHLGLCPTYSEVGRFNFLEEEIMKSKMFWIGGVVVLLLAVGVTVALAHGSDIHACVNNTTGKIHIIGEGDNCKSSEYPISWDTDGRHRL